MRVLIFTAAHKADASGVQNAVLGLARYLKGEGHAVVAAWPDGDGTGADWQLRLEAGVGPSGRPTAPALVRASADATRLALRLARFRPDVVNLHYPRGQTIYFEHFRRVFGYRVVLSFHGSDYHEASEAVRSRLPGWMRDADAVTAVSEDLGRRLSALAPATEPIVIANGIDAGFWSPDGTARDPGLSVAAGRLIPLKGFDLLIRAFADPNLSGHRLVIVGEGPERAALRDLIASLGLAGRVTLAGRLDPTALRALFRRASLFVLPSEREGMPLTLLEAMATGLSAVAFGVGGVPSVLTAEAGELVPPGEGGALARAMSRRLGQEAVTRREGGAGRARILAQFTAERSYRRYETLLGSSVCRSPAIRG